MSSLTITTGRGTSASPFRFQTPLPLTSYQLGMGFVDAISEFNNLATGTTFTIEATTTLRHACKCCRVEYGSP